MDVNLTYCDDHFTVYTNIESLCCTPETNVSYTSIYFCKKIIKKKKTVVHPGDGILFSTKKKWATKPWKDMKKCTLISERSQSEKTIYCMIPTIWHSGENKTMETMRKISGFQGEGIFRAVKTLWMILYIMHVCHYCPYS